MEIITEEQMSEADLAFFKNLLLKKRAEVMEQIDYFQKTITDSAKNNGNSSYGLHMAELGTDAMEREKNFSFLAREKNFLRKIDAALERIKHRTYGICRVTGQIIDHDRLKAVPTTTISYQAKIANENGNRR